MGWIKRHWILSLFLLVASAPTGLNYSGFCWEQKRWLSDEEMIRGAISELLSWGGAKKYIGLLPYTTIKLEEENVDEFLKNNSDCCYIARGNNFPVKEAIPYASDGIKIPDLEEKIKGQYRDLIVIYYNQNYLDLEKNAIEKTTVASIPMTNCGTPYRWED